jgi:hypothetical protein
MCHKLRDALNNKITIDQRLIDESLPEGVKDGNVQDRCDSNPGGLVHDVQF